MTRTEETAVIGKAWDYIVAVTEKQGQLLPVKDLYGDGSRWLPLSRNGFEIVYNEIKNLI